MFFRTLIAVTLLAALSSFAQQPPQLPAARPSAPTMNDAQARMTARDFAGAAKLLEAITAQAPANHRAWQMLGAAYLGSKDANRASPRFAR